jgi:polyisoprenoid-binding protein YceI
MISVQPAGAIATRTAWRIDPAPSSVRLSVRHLMISRIRGQFHDLEGTVRLDQVVFRQSSVVVAIGAGSIDTGVPERDLRLRSVDFLDVAEFPRIAFLSRRIEGTPGRFRIVGDLTLHGVRRLVTLEASCEGRTRMPGAGERIGFSATATLDRRDFGLGWSQPLESGDLVVGHEATAQIELEAARIEAWGQQP